MIFFTEAMIYLLPSFIVCIIYLVISEVYLRLRGEQASWMRRILILLFGLYLTMVFAITVSPVYGFLKAPFGEHINMVPFQAINTFQSAPLNFFGNIVMFMPLGFMLVMLSKKCWKLHITILFGAWMSLLIEFLQLWETRGTDIDDVLLNTFGTFLGYCIANGCFRYFPSIRRHTGIILLKTKKAKKKDLGGVVLLSALMLFSVFFVGFSQSSSNGHMPELPIEGDEPVSIKSNEGDRLISENLKIGARNAFVWNVTSNQVLYEKDSKEQIATASTAKMLTALTVLDYCDTDEKVFIGKETQMIGAESSRVWLRPGNELTVGQLLNALLLPSGNDAAYSLAVYTGRKIDGDENISIEKALAIFIETMNDKAVAIGAVHSKFASPDGYDTTGQYSTAYDLGLIAREFCKSKALLEIAGNLHISDVWLSGEHITHDNTNELLNPDSQYYFKNAVGLKTGTSEEAGYCLVSAAYIKKQLYICVVMGSSQEGRWSDSLSLYHAIQDVE